MPKIWDCSWAWVFEVWTDSGGSQNQFWLCTCIGIILLTSAHPPTITFKGRKRDRSKNFKKAFPNAFLYAWHSSRCLLDPVSTQGQKSHASLSVSHSYARSRGCFEQQSLCVLRDCLCELLFALQIGVCCWFHDNLHDLHVVSIVEVCCCFLLLGNCLVTVKNMCIITVYHQERTTNFLLLGNRFDTVKNTWIAVYSQDRIVHRWCAVITRMKLTSTS